MKVGLVCPYDLERPGGVQAQVIGLARVLGELGDEVRVIGPGRVDDVDSFDVGESVTIPANRSRVPISVDPRVVGRVKSASSGFDLLHVHEPLMPLVSLAALRAGVPVVATFHAAPAAFASWLYSAIRPGLKTVLGPNVRRLTAVSPTAAAPVADSLAVEIIPNGVSVASFARDVARRPRQVCFLGRDEPRKGLPTLLEAWGMVQGRCPEAELVVMGAGGDVPGVKSMGWVDDRTKADVLASSAIFVAPNLGGESFGIVLVEAMAAGAAVIASDLESFQAVGGDSARYFPAGDPHALAAALIDLLEDEVARRALQRAGPLRAETFDWSVVAAAYRSVYEQALS